MSYLLGSPLVENSNDWLKTISASSVTSSVPAVLKKEKVAAIVLEPIGVESSANETTFTPSRPTSRW